MQGYIVLADAARAHPDGTFSLLRGGIDRVHTPRNQPIQFRGSFVARITGTMTEAGEHQFRVRILTEDGQPLVPDIAGNFRVQEGGGSGNIVFDFAFHLPRYGRYTFALLVDNQERATWDVRAVEAAEQGREERQ